LNLASSKPFQDFANALTEQLLTLRGCQPFEVRRPTPRQRGEDAPEERDSRRISGLKLLAGDDRGSQPPDFEAQRFRSGLKESQARLAQPFGV
jgi:hypothetical protein